MKKSKKTAIPQTLEDCEGVMCAYASADAAHRALLAQMDGEITAIRERYAAALSAEENAMREAEDLLASWATLNRAAFGDKQHLKLTHGVIGFRLGTPAVRLKGRTLLEAALQSLKEHLPMFVRVEEVPDKAAILAAYAGGKVDDDQLSVCGLKVTQTERFFVTPKTEEVVRD